MSTNLVNKTTGELTTLANGTRVWIGSKSAHDLAIQQGTMPNNCMVCITDDGADNEPWEYSTEETKTGKTWIDGKPIYRKVVDCGKLPSSAGLKSIPHNITDMDVYTKVEGYMGAVNHFTVPLGNPTWSGMPSGAAAFMTQLSVGSGSVQIAVNGNASAYSAYVILEYTKTTD